MSVRAGGERSTGMAVPEGQASHSVGSDWRARLETSCDNSDLTEMEQQVIEQLPSGYFYDPEECVIVRNSLDLPESISFRSGNFTTWISGTLCGTR